nr:flagellar hook-length control protein FliK [Sporosarcina aquimarina]
MREFQAILNRANFGQTGGTNRLMVKLYPEHLGQVRIELLEINGVMTARILASTAMAREMLDSQIHQLRHAFNQQNLQVERIDLSQTIQEPSKNDREQAFNKQNEQQKEQLTEQDQNQDEQERTFEEFMIELEV